VTAVKRSYDTTRRRAQAAATRQDVLDAAGELFGARGYASTTIDEIAAEAGVSRETIFKVFGSKRQVLQGWVDREVAGVDEPVPIQQQTWMGRVRDATDQHQQVALAIAGTNRIHDRAIDAIETLRAAAHADPEIAAVWREGCAQRRRDVVAVTALLAARGPTRGGLSDDEVVDVLYALTSPELYGLLVRQCGWRPERFERWLIESVVQLVLGRSVDTSPSATEE